MRSPERSDSTKEVVMTEPTSPALEIALAYFHAWTGHDLDKAMEYIADDSSAMRRPAGWKAPRHTGDSWGRSFRS